MKKKILAISICVCICFALLAIPAFATSVPETTSAPNVFDTLLDSGAVYNCSVSGYATTKSFLQNNGATSLESAMSVSNGVVSYNGNSYNFDSFYYYTDADLHYLLNGTQVFRTSTGSPASTFTLSSIEGLNMSGVTVTTVGTDGLVQSFAGEVFAVGGGLISFVMSHWIVLIPVVAFLVILCIGAIRKIIKGV